MPLTRYQGFTLVEFVIAMALSMTAMAMMFAIFITCFMIDNKSIKFTNLADEVANISALLSEDLKRAGFVNNAEQLLLNPASSGSVSRCAGTDSGCSNIAFRTLTISHRGNESINSCITFAYDHDQDGRYNYSASAKANNSDAMGYRLRNQALEVRHLAKSCRQGHWRRLTDPDFVIISKLIFTACGRRDNTAAKCAAFSFPPTMPPLPAPQVISNDQYQIRFSFTATLTTDPSVSLTTTQHLVVPNASYN